MLYFSGTRATLILLTLFAICACAVPNFLPDDVFARLPTWAQRHLVLGLDLRGGSHLLLEVDAGAVRKEMTERLREEVIRALREGRIGYTSIRTEADAVQVQLRDSAEKGRARAALSGLSQPLGGVLSSTNERTVDLTDLGDGSFKLAPTPAAIDQRVRQAAQESIPIVERRINALGTVEPTVEREGSSRIVVEVPGLQNPAHLEALLGKTAKLTFQIVDLSTTPEQALRSGPPPGTEILYDTKQNPPSPYLVHDEAAVSGADLVDAQPAFDRQTDQPIVTFRLNSEGARRFADVTRENVGRPFAIVLDNEVVSAPVIREPILGGNGEISGNFTVQQANDLAILLRAGALPAPLTTVEEQTIGPGLGQDSIAAGEIAALAGSLLVVVFMLATYGLFGLFADIAVAANVAMIFGVLSLLNATLTLPGIAGIVLTVGIAVDSNVLVYERIREEFRHGRSAVQAIDAGFKRALATILDSNLSTLIAAGVLFFIGTGAVRGFAVTLGVGIATTLFTAFTLTRLMVSWWVGWARPKSIPI